MRKLTVAALASVLAVTPITNAHATTGGLDDTGAVTQRDDDDFPWGLLGLLGLAGLLGLKRRDHDRDHHRTTTDTMDRR